MSSKRSQTRSSSLRKPASAILIYYASALWKTFANRHKGAYRALPSRRVYGPFTSRHGHHIGLVRGNEYTPEEGHPSAPEYALAVVGEMFVQTQPRKAPYAARKFCIVLLNTQCEEVPMK